MTAVCLELLNTCRSQGKRKQEKRQQPQLAVAGVNSAAVNQPGPGRADRCRARFEAAGRAHVAVRARAYDRCGEPGGEPAGRPGVIKRRRTSPAAFAFGQGIITLLTHMVITLSLSRFGAAGLYYVRSYARHPVPVDTAGHHSPVHGLRSVPTKFPIFPSHLHHIETFKYNK